jgi:hypothetical protein
VLAVFVAPATGPLGCADASVMTVSSHD